MQGSAGGIGGNCVLIVLILIAAAGCSAPARPADPSQILTVVTTVPLPSATTVTASTIPATTRVTVIPSITRETRPANTTVATTVPIPTTTPISEAALNARIVDARNKLEMLIDSNVADTIISHHGGTENCEIKKSKELGYLIDVTTGESTFVKGITGVSTQTSSQIT